jgi:hypothetical protein
MIEEARDLPEQERLGPLGERVEQEGDTKSRRCRQG